jgi:hypothetical protein
MLYTHGHIPTVISNFVQTRVSGELFVGLDAPDFQPTEL